jgi:hypothetical protein
MKMDGRRGCARAFIGFRRSVVHDCRRRRRGPNALSAVTDALEMEDVSKRVGFRLFAGVDGIANYISSNESFSLTSTLVGLQN